MRHILINILHIFVIFMMGSFLIFGIMAINGKFDHWAGRYIQKAKHIISRMRRYIVLRRKRGIYTNERSAYNRPS